LAIVLLSSLEDESAPPTSSASPIVLEEDPCPSDRHTVLANEVRRSFNAHLDASAAALCDRDLPEGWYRFKSPAGNVLATECPGGNYCGTQKPVWMKGTSRQIQNSSVF
jgi:hypothetical protein